MPEWRTILKHNFATPASQQEANETENTGSTVTLVAVNNDKTEKYSLYDMHTAGKLSNEHGHYKLLKWHQRQLGACRLSLGTRPPLS